jgi:hypothetical protein
MTQIASPSASSAARERDLVKWRILAVCVDEDVGVDGDHAPRSR